MSLRSSLRLKTARLTRLSIILCFGISASLVTSSCLTPEATFTNGDGDGDGDKPGDGDGDTSVAGANGGDGDGDVPLPTDHCLNRRVDADETDTDCGGQDCDPCAVGRDCKADIDCANNSCTMGKCQMPTCTDGVKNAGETDEDCGGTGCPACGTNKRCEDNEDCRSLNCDGGTCAAATCDDRIANGSESDRDCGGNCDPCDSGFKCVVDDDCLQPADGVPGISTCDDGICTIACGPGLGDCNNKALDGCETNTNIDLNHCGACAEVCDPDHAVGRCENGMCGLDTDAPNGGCLGNWWDCNNDPVDGCEANLMNDPDNCGACATDDPTATCSQANGTASCSSGVCGITCQEGYDDCDEDPRHNGCEAKLSASILHCGECGNACTPNPGESAACDTSLTGDPCVSISCESATDCSGVQPCGACNDAICNDRLDSTTNCGGCGISCTVSNGTPTCTDTGGGNFQCDVLSCASGGGEVWNDCDDSYQNGCEVNTQTSKFRCGGCLPSDPNPGSGEDCNEITSNASLHVSATQCTEGGCKIVSCSTGYADCNGIFSDGCEVNTTSNGAHCGGCTSGPTTTWDGGFVCNSLYENGSGKCQNSVCSFDKCDTDYGDCNSDAQLGAAGDGCEEYLVGNDDNCGACGNTCTKDARTSGNSCTANSNRACSPTCSNSANFGNCDGNGANGCEALLQTAEATCGSCGTNCNSSIGSNNISSVNCASGACEVVNCSSNRADCNGTFSDGCEVNTSSSATHCGGCTSGPTTTWDGGVNCSSSVGTNSITGVTCGTGSCRVTTCATNRADCNGTFSDGCEINTSNNVTHCGGCTSGPTDTWDGGVTCATKANATTSCSTGTCSWTCNSGWKDANGDLNNSSSNGCERAILTVAKQFTATSGTRNSGDLEFTYTLQTSRATNPRRGLILILGNSANNASFPTETDTTTVGGVTLTSSRRVNFRYENQATLHMYYVLDADLPAGASDVVIHVYGHDNNTMRWTAQVLEVTNLDQSAPLGFTTNQGQGGMNCTDNVTTNISTNADALVVTALNTANDANLAATASTTGSYGLPTVVTEAVYDGADTIAGYWQNVTAGTFNARWSCSGSDRWIHLVASFNPEGTD